MEKCECVYTVLAIATVLLASQAVYSGSPDTAWTLSIGGDGQQYGYCVEMTADGGYVVAGTAVPQGGTTRDFYLVRTDADGHMAWERTYGGIMTEEAYEVKQTSDGGYILVGFTSTYAAGQYDVYLVRTDQQGDTLWTRSYGGQGFDYGYSVAELPDGGFIVAGRTSSSGDGPRSAYLIRTDAYGDTVWTRTHGGWWKDEAYSVIPMGDDGFVMAGYTTSYGAGGRDMWLLRLDASGDTLWTRTYGGLGNERAQAVRRASDGGFILAGRSNSFNPHSFDVYLVKTAPRGIVQWTRTYGGVKDDHAFSIEETMDGGFVAAGYSDSFGSGLRDIYVIRVDAAGDTLWTKTLGGALQDWGYSVHQTPDGGYLVGGWTLSPAEAADYDVYLARLKPSDGCPSISAVSDVPSDDGGLVNITWLRSFYDGPGLDASIRRYRIWRRVAGPAISLPAMGGIGDQGGCPTARRYEMMEDGPLWELVGTVPATGDPVYSFTAETHCDSGQFYNCMDCFFISAHRGLLGTRFESPVACGYSVDNSISHRAGASESPARPEPHASDQPPQGVAGAGFRMPGVFAPNAPLTVQLSLHETCRVTLDIYDVAGRRVANILDDYVEAGTQLINCDAGAGDLRFLASGTYFVRLKAGSKIMTSRLIVMK